jgi:hypothetical protein
LQTSRRYKRIQEEGKKASPGMRGIRFAMKAIFLDSMDLGYQAWAAITHHTKICCNCRYTGKKGYRERIPPASPHRKVPLRKRVQSQEEVVVDEEPDEPQFQEPKPQRATPAPQGKSCCLLDAFIKLLPIHVGRRNGETLLFEEVSSCIWSAFSCSFLKIVLVDARFRSKSD